MENNFNDLKTLIDKFCSIILIKGDKFDDEKAKEFIKNLSSKDKDNLNIDVKTPENTQQLTFILQNNLIAYLRLYDKDYNTSGIERPFEFDSAGNYRIFFKTCCEYYKKINHGASFPQALVFSLEYIHGMSEHYKIFSNFYTVRSIETENSIIERMKKEAEFQAREAVKTATAESAEEKVKEKVDEKMIEVSKQISSSSVTILDMFSGIVLTVVAGLFYSSSVLENVNSANFFRLLSISALVGIVCINLLTTMFVFIEKIGKHTNTLRKSFKISRGINIILLIVMFVGFVFQFFFPAQEQNEINDITNLNGQVSVNVVENTKGNNDTESFLEQETEVETTHIQKNP